MITMFSQLVMLKCVLYFDGVYQERKYGSSVPVVDVETGEILTKKENGQNE